MGVARPVSLECEAVAVVTKAVRLDDQPAVAPEEIDFVRAGVRVEHWLEKAMAATEAQEDSLELAAGEVVLALEIV